MPTYEYACSSCGHLWEQEQRIVEPALDTCPACKEKTARRLISAGNFILKGGGWYADLYSKPSSKKADGGERAESKSSDKGGNGASKSGEGASKSGEGASKSGEGASKSGESGSKPKESSSATKPTSTST